MDYVANNVISCLPIGAPLIRHLSNSSKRDVLDHSTILSCSEDTYKQKQVQRWNIRQFLLQTTIYSIATALFSTDTRKKSWVPATFVRKQIDQWRNDLAPVSYTRDLRLGDAANSRRLKDATDIRKVDSRGSWGNSVPRRATLPRCLVLLPFDSEFLHASASLSIPEISNHSYCVCSRFEAVRCSILSSKLRLCSLNDLLSLFVDVESSDEFELSFAPSVI